MKLYPNEDEMENPDDEVYDEFIGFEYDDRDGLVEYDNYYAWWESYEF